MARRNGRRGVLPALVSIAVLGSALASAPASTAAAPSFTWSHLKAPGGGLVTFNDPTSLQFGPDGRLYVAYQNGVIRAYTIKRNGKNDYQATAVETIEAIKNIANHDDDGSNAPGVKERLLLGIAVAGTAANPIIYASSSDPRFGALSGELDLDTNSGIVSKLTKSGGSWTRTDLVRGIPRSKEIHAPNGLALKGSKLYLAVGGHTNHGAPSNNFGLLPEYALSAAILEIDLSSISSPPYDLPTLNDPDRAGPDDANDPFGGNSGKNQAKLPTSGPVKLYASGFRNAYDLVWHSNGSMYVMDNGGNNNAGGTPVKEGPGGTCTNANNTGGVTDRDGLYRVTGAGYYQGHPNPTRGNADNTFAGQSPIPGGEKPIECDYQSSGEEGGGVPKDPANDGLTFFSFSTNGIAEYKASNFGGQMKGDLIVAQFDYHKTGTVYRVELGAGGGFSARSELPVSGYGNDPLDAWAQPDGGPFPGTIWVAMYGSNQIAVFEPSDYSGGGGPPPCSGADSASLDEDGDGFDNADEIDNGTDPCSAGSVPPDADGDKTSDLNDPDDDDDGRSDVSDPFQLDPTDGRRTKLPTNLSWDPDDPEPGGLLDSGFTGMMTNGRHDYLDLFDEANMTVGSAAGVFTIDEVPNGDATGQRNNQAYGFQLGVDPPSRRRLLVKARIAQPFIGGDPVGTQSVGIQIGSGSQRSFLKLVAARVDGGPGVRVVEEQRDRTQTSRALRLPMRHIDYLNLTLIVDPRAGTVQAVASTTKGCAPGPCTTGASRRIGRPIDVPRSWLEGPSGLAVGLIATSRGAPDFPATWDRLRVSTKA